MKKISIGLILIAAGVYFGVFNPVVFGTLASSVPGTGNSISVSPSLTPVSDSPDPDAFAFEVTSVERCGPICGQVTAKLTNRQHRQETNVVVNIQVVAGQSLENGQVIWTGREQIGTMAARETVTITRQAEIPASTARAVPDHGGWVTVVVTIDSSAAKTILKGKEQVV